MNVSFFRISSSRESTQRFSATFPCLIPIPYGSARNVSFVSFADWIGRRDPDERRCRPTSARPRGPG